MTTLTITAKGQVTLRKAAALGRRGGSVTSDKKRESAQVNGAKGGRPRKVLANA